MNSSIEEDDMGTLKAGMAKVVITPPVGTKLAGYAGRTEPSTEILDNLYAKALVLDDGNERLALVVCDLIWYGIDLVNETRDIIQKQSGVKPDNIMITCTHTHCGPNLRSADKSYVEGLKFHIAGAVASAVNTMREARIGVNKGECYTSSNRRNPNSPSGPYNLYKYPEGTMDPTVMTLRVEDTSGNMIGIMTNYAGHPVGWGSRELGISRDYPGFALEVLEKVLGDDIVAMFMQGCCGNLNLNWIWDKPEESPMPPRRLPLEREPRLREVRRLGRILGAETLKVAEYITDLTSDVVLKGARKDVEVRIREDMPERMQKGIDRIKAENEPLEPGRRGSIQNVIAAGNKTITTEVQVFRIGDYFVVGLPSEVFNEYQIEIRKKSEVPYTFVSELANDSIAYVPTPEAYKEGGYEANTACVAPDAGIMLVDNAIGLVKQLG
jgi:neutral ceramidase